MISSFSTLYFKMIHDTKYDKMVSADLRCTRLVWRESPQVQVPLLTGFLNLEKATNFGLPALVPFKSKAFNKKDTNLVGMGF